MCEIVMPDLAAPRAIWEQWRDSLAERGLTTAEIDLYRGLANAAIAGASAPESPNPFAHLPLPERNRQRRAA